MAIHCNKGVYDMNISILKSTELIHHIILEKRKECLPLTLMLSLAIIFRNYAQIKHF